VGVEWEEHYCTREGGRLGFKFANLEGDDKEGAFDGSEQLG